MESQQAQAREDGLLVWYKFDEQEGGLVHSGNDHHGTLKNGTNWVSGRIGGAVRLNGKDGYIALPSGILSQAEEFTAASWMLLESTAVWQRLFDLGSGKDRYLYFTPLSDEFGSRFTMKKGGSDRNVQRAVLKPPLLTTRVWHHIAVTLSSGTATIYVDGLEAVRQPGISLTPAGLGATTQNFIGKSQYANDPAFAGQIDDFRLYDRSLNAQEIRTLTGMTEQQCLQKIADQLMIGYTGALVSDLPLPDSFLGAAIKWSSGSKDALSPNGKVSRPPQGNAESKLTAELTGGKAAVSKSFAITVLGHSNQDPNLPVPPVLLLAQPGEIIDVGGIIGRQMAGSGVRRRLAEKRQTGPAILSTRTALNNCYGITCLPP